MITNRTKSRWLNWLNRLRLAWLFNLMRVATPQKKKETRSKAAPKKKPEGEYVASQYRNLSALLEDLDNVFADLKSLKPQKHQVQRVVSKYGAYLMNMVNADATPVIQSHQLEGFKAYGLPTFLICWNRPVKANHLNIFHCAIKARSFPVWRKKPDCVYYEWVSIILMDGSPFEFYAYMEVNKKTGEVNPLPSQIVQSRSIMHKSAKKHGRKFESVSRGVFQYPDFRDDEVAAKQGYSQTAIKDWLRFGFISTYNVTMFREYTINVIAIKGKHRVTFSVPQNEWKRFFSDRVKVKTLRGNTRPIFHAVVAHKRKTKTKEAYVKTHYRGLRHFAWGEYKIGIVMPGKHGLAQADFDIETTDCPQGKGTVSVTGAYADKLNRLFDPEMAA